MASDPDKQTLPCLGCLRIMSTTVYQSNDPPRKCIFGPGASSHPYSHIRSDRIELY